MTRARWRGDAEAGSTAIEYALIASLIALVIVAAVTLTGGTLLSFFSWLGGYLNEVAQ